MVQSEKILDDRRPGVQRRRMRLSVLMTSFNRKETTLRCLRLLRAQRLPSNAFVETFLVDDASTDGTVAAVRSMFPEVHVLEGTGSLYWTGGMARADEAALAREPDYLLWLNDDVELGRDALHHLLYAAMLTDSKAIVVGAVLNSDTGEVSYGGYQMKNSRRPLHLELVVPNGNIQDVDTMNGNVVMVPSEVRRSLGPLDLKFKHNMADMDYAFRARRAGCRVVLSPEPVGSCMRNTTKGKWQDPSLPLNKRLQLIFSFRGLPPREWLTFTRRHTGWRWPRYFLGPYFRCLLPAVASALQARRSSTTG